MGFLDRLKSIRFFPEREQEAAPQLPPITLRKGREAEWTVQLLHHKGLDDAFERFARQVTVAKQDILEALTPFTDDKRLAAIPERARTVNALHGSQYAKQVRKLLEQASFDEIFTFDEQHERFRQALDGFRDQTKKNVAALGEYLGGELQRTQDGIKRIEDSALQFLQALEESGFEHIRKLHGAQERLAHHDDTRGKREELLATLTQASADAAAKRAKIEAKIAEQRGLIRNQQALQALEQLGKVEEELDDLASKYEKACMDAAKYYKKYPDAVSPKDAARVLTELPKDPARYLSANTDAIQAALAAITEQVQDEGRNVGNLASRLRDLSQTAARDAARVRELLPKQTELRRGVMGDVAALNIYDQQQFLLRARREEAELQAKIAYVRGQLDGEEHLVMERDAKDAIIALGARIEGHPLEEATAEAEHELEETERITSAQDLLREADEELAEEQKHA